MKLYSRLIEEHKLLLRQANVKVKILEVVILLCI